ncbi:MAG: hypothetical protein JSS66_08520 [Armatimonadetes bacterium]|nr:hypothetical protein [Armatimonadota bacterium]
MTPVERQIEDLRKAYGEGVASRQLPSGALLLTLPDVSLPPGWSKSRCAVKFIVPVGYPYSAPDCFWADRDLLLATGQVPQATNFQDIPEANEGGIWFSWHVQGWNPNRSSLVSYAKVIENRFKEVR